MRVHLSRCFSLSLSPSPGIKFTDTNFYLFQQLHHQASTALGYSLNALTGPDEMALAGLIMGSDGAIGSTYNVIPKINTSMHAAFKRGDVAQAMELQKRANIYIHFILRAAKEHGVPVLTGVIGQIKACYRMRGIDVGRAKGEATNPITKEMEESLAKFMESQPFTFE